MYKWQVTVLELKNSLSAVPYNVTAGPGSLEDDEKYIIISNNAEDAAEQFYNALQSTPNGGGWGSNPDGWPTKIRVTPVRTSTALPSTEEFRFNPPTNKWSVHHA